MTRLRLYLPICSEFCWCRCDPALALAFTLSTLQLSGLQPPGSGIQPPASDLYRLLRPRCAHTAPHHITYIPPRTQSRRTQSSKHRTQVCCAHPHARMPYACQVSYISTYPAFPRISLIDAQRSLSPSPSPYSLSLALERTRRIDIVPLCGMMGDGTTTPKAKVRRESEGRGCGEVNASVAMGR